MNTHHHAPDHQILIAIESLKKTYGRGHVAVNALDNISLTIPRGAFWAIMGASGSGKSTLMHLIGLLDRPTEGSIRIDANTIDVKTDLSVLAKLRRQLIGFIFQQFFLLPRATALDNVILPSLYAKVPMKQARARAEELLREVGLAERMQHKPNELSGGEQQRVAIARSLMNDPALILADEPTGNLDSKNGAVVLDFLDRLHAQGKTILLVTHDHAVGKRAEKIVQIADGRLV